MQLSLQNYSDKLFQPLYNNKIFIVKREGWVYDWASEASPTLGCSIEISRGMSVGMYVCRGPKSVGGIT